jgi:hypothetical protein
MAVLSRPSYRWGVVTRLQLPLPPLQADPKNESMNRFGASVSEGRRRGENGTPATRCRPMPRPLYPESRQVIASQRNDEKGQQRRRDLIHLTRTHLSSNRANSPFRYPAAANFCRNNLRAGHTGVGRRTRLCPELSESSSFRIRLAR